MIPVSLPHAVKTSPISELKFSHFFFREKEIFFEYTKKHSYLENELTWEQLHFKLDLERMRRNGPWVQTQAAHNSQ